MLPTSNLSKKAEPKNSFTLLFLYMRLALTNASPIDFYIFFHMIPYIHNTNIQRTMEKNKGSLTKRTSTKLKVLSPDETYKLLQDRYDELLANYTLAQNTLLESSNLADEKLVEQQFDIGTTLSILRGIGWKFRRILASGSESYEQQLKKIRQKLHLIPSTPWG